MYMANNRHAYLIMAHNEWELLNTLGRKVELGIFRLIQSRHSLDFLVDMQENIVARVIYE